MPDLTEKLKLKKPRLNEAADIQVINENMDTLDTVVGQVEDKIIKVEKELENLSNYDDTQIKADITAANTAIGQLQTRTDNIDAVVQALKQYPINESLTLSAANQTDTTPSTYTVTDSRYTAAVSDWDIKPGINITEAESEALSNADIDIDGSHDGYFTLTANGDKPTIDLPILVKIWRL